MIPTTKCLCYNFLITRSFLFWVNPSIIVTGGIKMNNENTTGNSTLNNTGGKKSIEFAALPVTLEEFMALPQAKMQTPYETAAMFVIALHLYPQNKDVSIEMINCLKGPSPLSARDISLFKTQVTNYLVRSYFTGAAPQNDYAPAVPYSVLISDNAHSYASQGLAKLFVHCGGADSPRPIEMRLAKDNKWYLTGYASLLAGIRKPESADPWA